MNKLNVGDYVRTRWGCIAKFEGIHEGFYEFDNIIMDESSGVREELFVDIVEKSSPNITDLIEVGDIVNYGLVGGGMVLHKENDEIITSSLLFNRIKNKDIKTVITKEQIENNMYKVGDKNE